MAKTLLQGVNDVLKRVGIVEGASAPLTTLTSTSFQTDIDIVVQLWQEVVAQLQADAVIANQIKQGSITLATGTREYNLASDFIEMAGSPGYGAVFKCVAKNRVIHQYPTQQGENPFLQMFADMVDPANYLGDPSFYALSPEALTVLVDRQPTSAQNGDVYLYKYAGAPTLAAAADTFPFLDVIYDSLRPVVAELYHNRREGQAREPVSASNGYLRALELANRTKARRSYGRRAY